jgi:hypothetical protein
MTFKIRRFSDEKQDQVEQLIGYATMLGLSGKDLISIGGKMERDRSNMFIKRNLELIKSVEVYRIGNDVDIEQRFKIKTSNGNYNFENNGYSWPKRMGWYKRCQYRMLYDIATGVIQLNF